MTYILGVGGSNHDFSSTLLHDGNIKYAIEDERVNRVRYGDNHWASSPCKASVEYCLSAAKIEMSSIDHIFASSDIETNHPFWLDYPHTLVGHHLSHASSSFYTSPFKTSAVLVIDGRGEAISEQVGNTRKFETISYGLASENKLKIETKCYGQQQMAVSTWSYITSNSIGWFYSIITEAIGLGENGEGKTMALAAYGEPSYINKLSQFFHMDEESNFIFNAYSGIWDFLVNEIYHSNNEFKTKSDLAATAQTILETVVLTQAKNLNKITREKNLVYAGGVALNGVANNKIKRDSGFDNIFIFPACSDNGLSTGAALYGYFHLFNNKRQPLSWEKSSTIAFQGCEYSDEEIKKSVDKYPVAYSEPKDLITEVYERIKEGQIIAIFHGRSELGPRALGNRSIIASPASFSVQNKLNRIKRREEFRPFAPITFESIASEYFDIRSPSPFMLDIAPVKNKYLNLIPGACHFDGTARVQTINQYGSSLIIGILECFKANNLPQVILNTSFNLQGKPIVETPCDALDAFLKLELDALVLNNGLVVKHGHFDSAKKGINRHAY